MSQRDDLINLFTRYAVAQVSQSVEYSHLLKRGGQSEAFLALYNRIDGLKRELEVLFKGRAGREQVTLGIEKLREYESEARDPPLLIPTPEHDSADIKSNREELKKVVDRVINVVMALLTEVPPD